MANDERHATGGAKWTTFTNPGRSGTVGGAFNFFIEWTPCSRSSFDGNCVKFLPGDDNVTSWKFQGSEDDAGALLPLLGW